MTAARAIFIDKDGTLVRNVPYNVDLGRVRLAAGAAALAKLGRSGYRVVVVSNQPGIAYGYFGDAELERVGRRLRELLEPSGVYLEDFVWCPHAPRIRCACRKPADGLLRRVAAERGLALSESWMVGDILDDVEAGRRAGCRTVLIDNGNETEWRHAPLREPHLKARNLREAAALILQAGATR